MLKQKHFFKSDIGKAISSGYFLFFLNNIVALFLTPYILKFVTKQEYGLYVLCIDFLSWMIFLEFGSSKVMESKAAHLLAANDESGLTNSFNSALFFQLFIAILVVPIFYTLVKFGLQNNDIRNLNIIIIIFSISAGISVIRSNFSAMLIAGRKIHIDNKIQILINVLNYALILLLIPYLGLWGLAAITLLVAVLILIRSYKRVFYLYPYLKIDKNKFSKSTLTIMLSQGIYFSIASIATLLITKFDSFFLGKSFGLETVAKFYISIKLITVGERLFAMVINNVRPYISHFYGRKNIVSINMFYTLSVPLILALSLLSFSILMLANEYFVKFWVGDSFFIGKQFITLFGVFTILNIIALPARIVLTSTFYKLKTHSLLRVAEGILRLLIILLFIKDVQIIILPVSSIISSFLMGFISLHIILKSFFNSYSIVAHNRYLYLLISISLLVVMDQYFYNLKYTPFILLSLGLILSIHYYIFNRKKMISFIHLLKNEN